MNSNYQPGVNNDDPHFNLPDAGEDEVESELCARCGVPLTEADYEAEECTQCHEPL